MPSTPSRAVTTYDFNSINLTIYANSGPTTISLSPQQCIMLSQQLLTNALLCQHHTHANASVSTDTTPSSPTHATPAETVGPVEAPVTARSA